LAAFDLDFYQQQLDLLDLKFNVFLKVEQPATLLLLVLFLLGKSRRLPDQIVRVVIRLLWTTNRLQVLVNVPELLLQSFHFFELALGQISLYSNWQVIIADDAATLQLLSHWAAVVCLSFIRNALDLSVKVVFPGDALVSVEANGAAGEDGIRRIDFLHALLVHVHRIELHHEAFQIFVVDGLFGI
jgi:hypothetical protein